MAINGAILTFIARITTDPDHVWHWILLTAIGCLVAALLEGVNGYCAKSRSMLGTAMSNMLVNKILDSDVEMFAKHSPGVVSHTGASLWTMTGMVYTTRRMVHSGIEIIVNLVMITILSGAMVLPVLLTTAITAWILCIINRRWHALDNEVDVVKKSRNVELDEITNGYLEARSFPGAVEHHRKSLEDKNSRIFDLTRKRHIYTAALNIVIEVESTVAMFVVLC